MYINTSHIILKHDSKGHGLIGLMKKKEKKPTCNYTLLQNKRWRRCSPPLQIILEGENCMCKTDPNKLYITGKGIYRRVRFI